MDTSFAELTVNVVDPDILPSVAVIVALPGDTDVAFPLVPAIVATDGDEELHVAEDVRSWVLPSE